jgi:hypothetical protein
MSVLLAGSYSWSNSNAGNSISTSGGSSVSAVSISVTNASSSNCSAVTISSGVGGNLNGAAAYGGSMSVLWAGSYSWSNSNAGSGSSSSNSGATNGSGVGVSILNAYFYDCSAASINSGSWTQYIGGGSSTGTSAVGGGLSAVYFGAYTFSTADTSSSVSAATSINDVRVYITNALSSNCSAVFTTKSAYSCGSVGSSVYGGAVSAVYVGAYSSSFSNTGSSISICAETSAVEVSVSIRSALFNGCSALTMTSLAVGPVLGGEAGNIGASAFGGGMSVVYLASTSISGSESGSSSSITETTNANIINISVTNTIFSNSIAATTCNAASGSFATNVYGGSISVLYIGGMSMSWKNAGDYGLSTSGATIASDVDIQMSNISSSNSSAVTSTNSYAGSSGANAYGGSVSLIYVGAFAWSFSVGQRVGTSGPPSTNEALSGTTFATRFYVIVSNSSFVDSLALSRTLLSLFPFLFTHAFRSSETKNGTSRGSNVCDCCNCCF